MPGTREISLYPTADKLLVAVDCIIFGFDNERLRILLFRRKVEPFKNEWSVIGSFIKSSESVSKAAKRVVKDYTGLSGVFLKELITYGEPKRDPGGRVLSIAHYSLIRLEERQELSVLTHKAKWFDIDDIPELILDHNDMIEKSLERLRNNAKYYPIGFELLPEKFTIPQLQKLYEAIYLRQLDRRNFRKKIISMHILEKLDEKDKSTSKKGAYLYRFDKAQYEELKMRGFMFEI